MPRRLLTILGIVAALVGGCRKDGAGTAAPVPLKSDTIKAEDGEIQIDVGYRASPDRQVEVVVAMKAIGIEEMDKLVVDITVDGFVLFDGAPEWTGFVAPRQPIRHQARFQLLDGSESGALNVSVRRSSNSELLYEARLPFVADGDRLAPE